jgi:replicative DNA helicase
MNSNSAPTPSPGRQQLIAHLESIAGTIGYEHRVRSLHSNLLNQLRNPLSPGGQLDPVLHCVLCELDRNEPAGHASSLALSELAHRFEDYQTILGNLIPDWLVNAAQRKRSATAFDLGTNNTLLEDRDEYLQRLTKTDSCGVFPTGLWSVDEAMKGGLHGLTILLGDKGVGKTAFAVNCALSALRADPSAAVLLYSLDFSKRRAMDRLASCLLHVPTAELTNEAVRSRVASEIDDNLWRRTRIRERDFSWVMDHSQGTAERPGLTATTIDQDARVLLRQPGVSRVLIIIDLFQKMVLPSSLLPGDADQFRLDAIDLAAQRLRQSYGDDCVAFLIITEMRKREAARRKDIPTRDDIKGDGRIPSDADNVLILAPTRDISSDESEVLLRIDKGRDGVVRGDHHLRFLHRVNRFVVASDIDGSAGTSAVDSDHDANPFD